MVKGYFGLPGAGKTYHMVRELVENKNNYGRKVYTNFGLHRLPAECNFDVIYMAKPAEFIKVQDGIVLIDEAGLWLPSFIWTQIPKELIWKLAQVRKFGLDLYYTAQHPARVVKILREITFRSVYCTKYFNKYLRAQEKSGIDVKYGQNENEFNSKITRIKTDTIGSYYDTLEKVGGI